MWRLGGTVIPKELLAGPEAKQVAVLGSEEVLVLRGLRAKGCRGIYCGLETYSGINHSLKRRNLHTWKKRRQERTLR